MTAIKPAHGIVVPVAAWGHVRPLVHLALNLLHEHARLRLTLMLAPSVAPRVDKELASVALAHIHKPAPGSPAPLVDRLQLMKVTSAASDAPDWNPGDMVREAEEYARALPAYISALHVPDTDTPNRFEGVPPSFIMFDLFQDFLPDTARATYKALDMNMPALLGFCPSNAVSIYHHFAPEDKGGFIAKSIRMTEGDVARGRDEYEALSEYGFGHYGDVIKLPDLPPKYDYEFHPLLGAIPLPPPMLKQVHGMYNVAHDPDTVAIVCPTPAELERESIAAFERDVGRPLIMAGVQFPEPVWNGLKPETRFNSEDDRRVIEFLDAMEAERGAKSVIYVSFGSMFYPFLRPELVEWLVESLLEADMPFLFAHASSMGGDASPDLLAKIDAHPYGLHVKFAPQWQVLEHPAVGSFLSHCGSNSSAEAILSGLPLVAMPFAADQGEFASLWTDTYGCCITLKQTFTFKEGNERFSRLYDGTEVRGDREAVKGEMRAAWDTLRGPKGREMADNMAKVRQIVVDSWRDGESRRAVRGFDQFF